jgi:hypothetical protein
MTSFSSFRQQTTRFLRTFTTNFVYMQPFPLTLLAHRRDYRLSQLLRLPVLSSASFHTSENTVCRIITTSDVGLSKVCLCLHVNCMLLLSYINKKLACQNYNIKIPCLKLHGVPSGGVFTVPR